MRYMASGVSGTGAVTTATTLFGVGLTSNVSFAYQLNIAKVIFGVEQSSSYAQGSVEVGVYAVSRSNVGTANVQVVALPQSSNQSTLSQIGFANPGAAVSTGWTTPPTLPGNPLIRRSFPVLCESQWLFRGGELSRRNNSTTDTALFVFRTIPSVNPGAGGLSVTWTVFYEIEESTYG